MRAFLDSLYRLSGVLAAVGMVATLVLVASEPEKHLISASRVTDMRGDPVACDAQVLWGVRGPAKRL